MATRPIQVGDPDPLPNTVTVHYNPEGFPNDVTASDSHSVDLFQPVINLVKTGDTLSKATDPVTYTITLSNLSSPDTPPMVCAISDPTIPFSKNVTLAFSASDVSTVPFTIPQGAADPFVNTASVTCAPAGFTNVYDDEASWSTNLFQAAIELTKSGDELSKIGDAVDYVIRRSPAAACPHLARHAARACRPPAPRP